MKLTPLLAVLALLPLGCGEQLPTPSAPSAAAPAPAQRPTEVTVVDLTPQPPKAPPPPAKAPDPEGTQQGAEFGMIGLLNTGAGGDPNAPTAPWGKDDNGTDPLSARGNMWGDAIGDSFGAGGLGLAGTGPSAGGTGEGIGLGGIGTIGHGAGTGQGFGTGSGRLGGAHSGKPPSIRMGATTVSGRLPPEVIQRIVRQNFGRFRFCYQNSLLTSPNLTGKVVIKFEIDKTGAVSSAAVVKDTSMPDKAVSSCVQRAFTGLLFPEPEGGGKVIVTYPILFAPGEPAPAAAPTPAPAPAAPKSP